MLEEGLLLYKDANLERFKILSTRIKNDFGKSGIKVGHIAWIVGVVEEEDINANTIKIPAFNTTPSSEQV